MPHSSGGGSHSGGGHSGGGFSGGGHGGSGRSANRVSKNYFPNSRCFRYYSRDGIEHHVYARSEPQPVSTVVLVVQLVMMLFFALAGMSFFGMIHTLIGPVKELTPVYLVPDSYIEDNLGVIDNVSQLEETLDKFRRTTGVCPYILTVEDEDWEYTYSSLEAYAYREYLDRFRDEQHWLIVYSEPANAEAMEYVDWSWEGMQGDLTDPIITEDNAATFNSELQGVLMDTDSPGLAAEQAFANASDYMMERNADYAVVIFVVFFMLAWNGVLVAVIVGMVKSYVSGKRVYTEVPVDGTPNSSEENVDPWSI